jgi:hypothetical protein
MRTFISIAILLLGTGCTASASVAVGPETPPPPPPPRVTISSTWVHVDVAVVSSTAGETTLRDPSGATVIMMRRDVRTGAGGTELRVGGPLVAMMVDGEHPDQPGSTRISPAARPTGPSATAPPASSTGCFGMFEYRCLEGTFVGLCLGAQLCRW